MELSRRLNHELREWLMPLAVVTDQPFSLMSALMDELRRRKVLVPRFSVPEHLVQAARVRADQHTYGLLNLPIKGELPGKVDALLSPGDDEPTSRFAWLARPVGAPKAKHVLALLDRLAFVRTFPVQSNPRAFLPQSRLDHLAEEARRLSVSHLGDFEPQRRRATLMASLSDLSETLTDAVLDMHDRVMMGLLRDGEREAAEAFGLAVRPGPPTRTFRWELGGRNLSRREVWLRVAEVYAGGLPPDATGFQLGVENAHGTVAWVDSDAVSGLPRPYPRPSHVKSMLGTLRFKADCFRVGQPRLDLRRVQALLIRCDRRDERALAFDDVQVVKP